MSEQHWIEWLEGELERLEGELERLEGELERLRGHEAINRRISLQRRAVLEKLVSRLRAADAEIERLGQELLIALDDVERLKEVCTSYEHVAASTGEIDSVLARRLEAAEAVAKYAQHSDPTCPLRVVLTGGNQRLISCRCGYLQTLAAWEATVQETEDRRTKPVGAAGPAGIEAARGRGHG